MNKSNQDLRECVYDLYKNSNEQNKLILKQRKLLRLAAILLVLNAVAFVISAFT